MGRWEELPCVAYRGVSDKGKCGRRGGVAVSKNEVLETGRIRGG